jgi:hypothetical protein
LRIQRSDVPSFHGQSLTFVPKPAEVKTQDRKNKDLLPEAVLQTVPGLGQAAEQITGHENDCKQQHALVNPATHAPCQRRGR